MILFKSIKISLNTINKKYINKSKALKIGKKVISINI